MSKTALADPAMQRVIEIWEAKKLEGWTQQQLGELMGYPRASARSSVSQFLQSKRPQAGTLRKFADAVGVSLDEINQAEASIVSSAALKIDRPRTLPVNPIESTNRTDEHARRTVVGVIESYNGNYDAIAEAVQNSMDAIEDAFLTGLPGPFLLEITVDLKANSITVLDTGVGMTQEQICDAFAPSATFKDPVSAHSILAKRGGRHNYRGYKGVGLTYLAFGTDDIWIQSRRDASFVKARMLYGRKWAEGKRTESPLLDRDDSQLGLDKHKRGTVLKVMFSPSTRPASLSGLGSSIELWEAIIRTRTAGGQVLLGREALVPIKVKLTLINNKGKSESADVTPEFYYPHCVKQTPAFRFLDVWKYHKENPGLADHPPSAKRQDGVFLHWTTQDIREQLGDREVDFRDEINEHLPEMYAFRPYYATTWYELNEAATKQKRGHFFAPGLVVAIDRQRLADITPIKATRWGYTAESMFVLFHFDRAKPDLGRKTLQSKLMDLAQSSADAAVRYLQGQTPLLKQAGEKSTANQREVELGHEDWLDNVKAHAKSNPLDLPPITYHSEPLTEQDVVGLFNQMCSLGMFPGIQILATSSSHTYDCYVKFDYKGDLTPLRYRSVKDNPLGLSSDVVGPDHKRYQTRGLTLEFKNNLEQLVSDIESANERKRFAKVDILVCWSVSTEPLHKHYELSLINESNLHERVYPGVTHILRRDGEDGHTVQVVMLEEIVRQLKAGHIKPPR